MSARRKTVRFQDNASDLAVYNALSDYKSYGFRSESHMIIEAVRVYLANRNTPSELNPEELADLIAGRLSKTLTVSSATTGSVTEAETPNEDAFDAALDFINSF